MNNTPTPRTDAVCKNDFASWEEIAGRIQAVSQQLERELSGAYDLLHRTEDEKMDLRAESATPATHKQSLSVQAPHADTVRLDWLSRQHYGFPVSLQRQDLPAVVSDHPSPYLRVVIDDAMGKAAHD